MLYRTDRHHIRVMQKHASCSEIGQTFDICRYPSNIDPRWQHKHLDLKRFTALPRVIRFLRILYRPTVSVRYRRLSVSERRWSTRAGQTPFPGASVLGPTQFPGASPGRHHPPENLSPGRHHPPEHLSSGRHHSPEHPRADTIPRSIPRADTIPQADTIPRAVTIPGQTPPPEHLLSSGRHHARTTPRTLWSGSLGSGMRSGSDLSRAAVLPVSRADNNRYKQPLASL